MWILSRLGCKQCTRRPGRGHRSGYIRACRTRTSRSSPRHSHVASHRPADSAALLDSHSESPHKPLRTCHGGRGGGDIVVGSSLCLRQVDRNWLANALIGTQLLRRAAAPDGGRLLREGSLHRRLWLGPRPAARFGCGRRFAAMRYFENQVQVLTPGSDQGRVEAPGPIIEINTRRRRELS